MRRRVARFAGLGMILACVSGCATYAPLPLNPNKALAGDGVGLVRAAAVDRPYLVPASIDLAKPLDMNAIASVAVIANPDLKALRARAAVSDAQAFATRLLPDPTFSIGGSRVLSGPDPFVDIASALGLDLNALRTRPVRLAQARAEGRQVRLDLAWSEWQTAGQARIQAVRIVHLETATTIAEASRSALRSLLDRTMHAAGRGDLSGDRVQAAQTAAFDAQERQRTAERDLATARLELTRLLGLPPATRLTLASPVEAPAPPSAEALFALAQDSRADLQALRAGYDAQEAALHKAVLDQFPNLTLTINGVRDSAGNALLGPAVDFTLPLWNRNRGGIAIEEATRAALHAEYDARLFQTRAEIAAAVAGIGIARRQRESILADLPSLTTYAGASRRAADRGDLAPATAETAEQALRDKQLLLAQADQDIGEQMIALELLTGTPKEAWPR